jgi:glycosyltransferase involved in cell wall biosynthesis
MIGHDINLCALRPTPFAECKSAIKFYESAAIWNPAVTLGADFGPYQEIIDGETGFRYTSPKEFEWKLSELIENAPLRKQLAQNAQDWVHSYRDVRFTTGPYIDWLRSTSESVREYCSKALQSREPGVGEASPDESPNEPVRKLIVAER